MNENTNTKVNENTAAVNAGEAKAGNAAEASVASVEVKPCEGSDFREEKMQVNEASVDEALSRGNPTANPIRNGEILISTECEGNLSAFKKALKDGLIVKPDGLEAVSFHCAGFGKRDEGLVAKQFAITLKVNGKWQPLSRYAASGKGGHFAMGASQTLKGAKTLAQMLKAVWLHGMDLKKKSK